jgi:hypothetical protein
MGYVQIRESHSVNGNASLQNLVDNEEDRDQSIIYWPDKKYTRCKSEGGGSVLILRRLFFFQG